MVDDRYLYEFYFTNHPETVWGEYFNVSPSIVVPILTPDFETLCESYKVVTNFHLILAQKSSCFSMQDAFDNIIPLAFIDIEKHDLVYYEDNVLKFEFGEKKEITEKKLSSNFEIVEKTILKEEENDQISIINEEDESKEITNEDFNLVTEKETLTLYVNQEISHDEIKKILFGHGYKKVDYVYHEGEYAIRGSIIDIFAYNSNLPYKIDFQSNIIEKIYTFDIEESIPIQYLDEIIIDLKKETDYYGW